MIIAGQAFQPKSIEKFLLITFSILSIAGKNAQPFKSPN